MLLRAGGGSWAGTGTAGTRGWGHPSGTPVLPCHHPKGRFGGKNTELNPGLLEGAGAASGAWDNPSPALGMLRAPDLPSIKTAFPFRG